MRLGLAVLMAMLPSSLKRLVGRRLLGWDIHPTARIGRSLIDVRHLSMGPGSSIGRLNVIRGMAELRLGEGASIASRNWITGWLDTGEVFQHSPNRRSALILGDGAMITIHHEIDCFDRVEIGRHAGIVGFGCTVLTHNLDLVRDRFAAAPVEIGHHSAVMSGCTLLSGTRVPARSMVSAGSVVTTKLTQELMVYRGNPAEPVRALPDSLRIFRRGEPGGHQRADGL